MGISTFSQDISGVPDDLFQSLIGIYGNFNSNGHNRPPSDPYVSIPNRDLWEFQPTTSPDSPASPRPFQSLIGIYGNFNEKFPLKAAEAQKFQSLIGIYGNFNSLEQSLA